MRLNQLIVRVIEEDNAEDFAAALQEFYEEAGESEFVDVQFQVTDAAYVALVHYVQG